MDRIKHKIENFRVSRSRGPDRQGSGDRVRRCLRSRLDPPGGADSRFPRVPRGPVPSPNEDPIDARWGSSPGLPIGDWTGLGVACGGACPDSEGDRAAEAA
ncbi:MAG: hypothetical protein CMJ27_01775 [Phycisphaerae bacterium]|nr:hypothetical protein [Phycisphaerae bacterium]